MVFEHETLRYLVKGCFAILYYINVVYRVISFCSRLNASYFTPKYVDIFSVRILTFADTSRMCVCDAVFPFLPLFTGGHARFQFRKTTWNQFFVLTRFCRISFTFSFPIDTIFIYIHIILSTNTSRFRVSWHVSGYVGIAKPSSLVSPLSASNFTRFCLPKVFKKS